MAEAIILKDGTVVRKGNLTGIQYFTTGHLAAFIAPNGKQYTCAAYLDSKKELTFYVEESSFYTHIEAGEYDKMKTYNTSDWEKAETDDLIEIQKREILLTGSPSYCWNTYNRVYQIGEYFPDTDIPLTGFTINSLKSHCNLQVITKVALDFFNRNVVLSDDLKTKTKIADIAQLINNIDEYIYQSFNSEINLLKKDQKALWEVLDTSSLTTDSQRKDYYNKYYINLLDYYNLVKKQLYILNSSKDIERNILIAMSMHPKILLGLDVNMKIKMLKYLVKNILSQYFDKIKYEEFIINLIYSFDKNDFDNINLFLEGLINSSNSIPDTKYKEVPKPEEFEIVRNSVTLFEAIYTRMSQSWDITETIISWINYLPEIDFDPVLTRYNFVDAVYRLWRYSKFNPYKDNVYNPQLLSLVEDNRNTIFKYSKKPAIKYMANMNFTIDKTSGPVVINYKSEKKFGMYDQSFIFEFTGNNKICALTKDWNVIKSEQISEPPISKRWFPYGYYDIFQPITLIDHSNETSLPILTVDNADVSENLDNYNSIVPVFYIKYIAELNKRKNEEFLIFRTADVVTFFRSGGGLVNKLSHIRNLSKFQQVITLTETIQLSASVTEVVLDFVSNCNNTSSEFCKRLKILLGWIELSALGDDAMSRLQKKIAAKRFIKEIDFGGGIPADFDTSEGQEFISKVRSIAEGINDLNDIDNTNINDLFAKIKPAILNRINNSTNIFEIELFELNFPDDKLKLFIEHCINLNFYDPKFIGDIVALACRRKKTSTFDQLVIQLYYYKKVILVKGFPSGFKSMIDFKKYCNKAITFFEGLSFIGGKVLDYCTQGSVLFKRAVNIDPPDITNTPFLPNDPPQDLDVQLLMLKNNAINLVNELKERWTAYQNTLESNTKLIKEIKGYIKTLDKAPDKGIIHTFLIIKKVPEDIYEEYRVAIKEGGKDLFEVIINGEKVSDIGFSVIVKDSQFDILPVMSFKK